MKHHTKDCESCSTYNKSFINSNLPREYYGPQDIASSSDGEDDREDEHGEYPPLPNLIPKPVTKDQSGQIIPWADYVHSKEASRLPRQLADAQEVGKQVRPHGGPPPQPDVKEVTVSFSKNHKFTVYNYVECPITEDKVAKLMSDFPFEEEVEMIKFTELSSKADYCLRFKNKYQFKHESAKGTPAVEPRVTATCLVKTRAELLPDLVHKYFLTFFHTVFVYSPPGKLLETDVGLFEKSKLENISTLKICASAKAKRLQLKPVLVKLVQVTHYVYLLHSMDPNAPGPSAVPRPLTADLQLLYQTPSISWVDEERSTAEGLKAKCKPKQGYKPRVNGSSAHEETSEHEREHHDDEALGHEGEHHDNNDHEGEHHDNNDDGDHEPVKKLFTLKLLKPKKQAKAD